MASPKKPNTVLFVTGGAGFIGSNYLNKYATVHQDWTFICIDSLTYAANLDNILVRNKKNFAFEQCDIRDRTKLEALFVKYTPTGVIHFAAESHVDRSIKNPAIFIETNVAGTQNLLSLSQVYNLKRFLQISTDEVYGSLQEGEPDFTEQSPLAPNNPYSASKAAGDLLARSYWKTFGLDVVITRSSNNFGPHQDLTKVIPLFISNLLQGKNVPLYSKGENMRDWIYVEDNIDAIDLVFRKGQTGEIYNIGGSNQIRNIDLTRMLIKLTGRQENAISYVADRPGHDLRYALNSEKVKKLGWAPKMSFEEGLKKTFEYYKNSLNIK